MSWYRPIRSAGKVSSVLAALLLVSVAASPALAAETEGVVDDSNAAKNLARMNCGATIDLITPDGRVAAVPNATENNSSATALIMDDNTLSCPLQEGETTFIITFPRTSLLDRFTFLNENAAAEGEMKIAVSNYRLPADSPKWTDVNGSTAFTRKRLFNLSLVGVEARYVKLSFRVQKAGRIAALGLYGKQSLETFAARQGNVLRVKNTFATDRLEDMLNFNFANLYAKARVVFVSSGITTSARKMIDDDTTTAYRFAPADPHPTVIVELAESERLHRVSALYKMQAGRLDVYLLESFAGDPGDFSGLTPAASSTDANGRGKAALDFNPKGARYVAFRWTPAASNANREFEMAEVSAFGQMPLAMLSTVEFPDLFASKANASILPATPPVVPVIPQVSE